MSIFEAIMLVCFGAAWPLSIYKSFKTRSAVGKSVIFLFVVMIGYISGIIHKILFSNDFVMYLYIINLIMVAIDAVLYFRNRKLDKEREEAAGKIQH